MEKAFFTVSDSEQAAGTVFGDIMTPENLARKMGISLRTLARWNSLRIGPPRVVIGRTILYRLESVRQWMKDREVDQVCSAGRKVRE